MPSIYPNLKEDNKLIRRTVECQSDSESFVGSPKASSTPKGEGLQLRKTGSPVKEDETILAGYTAPPTNSIYYHDNTHSNTSIVHSLLSPDEYWNTFEDFKHCYQTGDWGDFIARHHLRILFVILLIMVVYSIYSSLTAVSMDRQSMWKDYRQELRLMRKDFPGLTKQDENALLVVGQQWIIDAHPDPVVLTIGGPNTSALIKKLYQILTKISKPKVLRPVIVANSKINRAQLHAAVKADLLSNSMPITAVQSIDNLVWDSPLVLQAFSDPESYLVPNSFVLLSVENAQAGATTCEIGLAEQLVDKWTSSGGNMDNVAPVISRITGYTICI